MNYEENEKVIDLKQMLYYALKRWKQMVLFLLIGALLGGLLGLVIKPKTMADWSEADLEHLNMNKITQYERANDAYKLQSEKQKNLLVMQMNPYLVYKNERAYFLTVPHNETYYLSERYHAVLLDEKLLSSLIAAAGLECEPEAIEGMIEIAFTTGDEWIGWTQSEQMPVRAKLSLIAKAADEETSGALIEALDAYIVAMHEQFAGEYSEFAYEKIADYSLCGYDENVLLYQDALNAAVKACKDKINALEKDLSMDERLYYAVNDNASQNEGSAEKKVIKYAVLGGALCVMLACCWIFVRFILDDHIKTVDDVTAYGLNAVGCLTAEQKGRQNWIDKLFADRKAEILSKEYLLKALKVRCDGKTVLCGDQQDAQMAEVMKWLAEQMEDASVADVLAKDSDSLLTAKEAENTVLFVRLWSTKAADLKRELSVLDQIDKPVKCVVVLRG